MITRNELGFKCDKCGYEWRPRYRDRIPKTCLDCKSKSWNGIQTDVRNDLLVEVGS